MEGNLYKWCGPFYRWQSRYCMVNNGQLDFYSSKDSACNHEAVLETHHVASCEINVDKNSSTAWTIQAPGKDLVYLKVDSLEERRYWLRLIGSAKACVADTSVLGNRHSLISFDSSVPTSLVKTELRVSKPELSSAQNSGPLNIPSRHSIIGHDLDQGNAEEVTMPIKSVIVDTARLSKDPEENIIAHSSNPSVVALAAVCVELTTELTHFQKHICEKDTEMPAVALCKDAHKMFKLFTKFSEITASITGKSPKDFSSHELYTGEAQSDNDDRDPLYAVDSGYDGSGSEMPSPALCEQKSCISTFFSTVEISFADVMNEANDHPQLGLLSSVRSESYIAACIQYTKFFDLFAGTLLAPLRSDILSNSEKVKKVFTKDPQHYLYMQCIIEDEISKNEHLHPDSATQAVLWMMRGLRTISCFLINACTPGGPAFCNAGLALESAYSDHLKRYHNFIVQRMFAVGLKFIPSFDHFKKQVVADPDVDVNSHEVDAEIRQQTITYSASMSEVVRSIEKVYLHHDIKL